MGFSTASLALKKENYMIDCKFELNGKPMSIFWCGATRFPAFSGLGKHVNKRISACILNQGPIPPGTYYIIDRQSGGLLGHYEIYSLTETNGLPYMQSTIKLTMKHFAIM